MKLSTRGRYGMRLMLDIAMYGGGSPVALKDIAARQEISAKYLEQIISRLSKAGLVRGTRGVGGGYCLSRPANQITAGDVLRALEGSLSFVDCTCPEEKKACTRETLCPTIGLWREMCTAMEQVTDNYTLTDLITGRTTILPCDRLA